MGAHRVSEDKIRAVVQAAKELDEIPFWRFLKRQEAAERFKWALYEAACEELGC